MPGLAVDSVASTRRSLLISFAENYSVLIITFISTIIIARLLTPEELGIFSVGAVIVGMAHIIRDFGVGQYLIQEKNLTTDKIRAAFGLTLVIAWGLATILALLSVPLASLYNEPGLKYVIWVLAANFLLIPFGSITMAYLRREMIFTPLYWIKVVSALVHSIAYVGFALWGLGYMSPAWAAMAGIFVTVGMTIVWRPKELPLFPGFKEMRNVVRFGSVASGGSVVGEINFAAPDLIIGKVLGMEAVGVFGKAMALLQIFNRLIMNSIWPVVLPHFSAQSRDGKDMKQSFLRTVSYVTGVAWPFFTFVALMSYPIVRILYGSQWDASVPLVTVLSISAWLASPFMLVGQLFIALGEVKKLFQMQVVFLILTLVALISSSSFGLFVTSLALAFSSMLAAFVAYRFLHKFLGLSFFELLKSTAKSFLVNVLTAIAPLLVLVTMTIGPQHLWLPTVIAMLGAGLAWIVGIFWVHHEMRDDLLNLLLKVKAMLEERFNRS